MVNRQEVPAMVEDLIMLKKKKCHACRQLHVRADDLCKRCVAICDKYQIAQGSCLNGFYYFIYKEDIRQILEYIQEDKLNTWQW